MRRAVELAEQVRGQTGDNPWVGCVIVKDGEVLGEGHTGDAAMVKALQDHVKAVIAPFKYPRSVKFRDALPKTESGKIQRFRLKSGA